MGNTVDESYLHGRGLGEKPNVFRCLRNPTVLLFTKDKARGLGFCSILFLKSSLILA